MSIVRRFEYFIKERRKVILTTFLICAGQLIVGGVIVAITVTLQTRSFIAGISQRVQEDIHYSHGQWDTSAYEADPEIPGNYRLYVITKDGFIIDRWRPISSYLNTSDLRYLLNYQQSTTIKAVTGQPWRILTLPIRSNGEIIGGITVGSYNFNNQSDTDLDVTLKQSGQKLLDTTHIKNGTLDTSAINVRQIPIGISFQIVDGANTILLKSNSASSLDRLPNYIDPSYITKELGVSSFRLIMDKTTGEAFISQNTPIYNQDHDVVGTVIIARTISPNLFVLAEYFAYGLLSSVFLALFIAWLTKRKPGIGILPEPSFIKLPAVVLSTDDITHIRFLKNESIIEINNKQIPITLGTNQHYMCMALFMAPKKSWHVDELLEKFGESNSREGWRKVYDAMTSINKKSSQVMNEKLITTVNKTYKFNPLLISKIKK